MALDTASDTATRLLPGVKANESGDTPDDEVQPGDGGKSRGAYQVTAGALEDVNKAFGTTYSPADLDKPAVNKEVAQKYLTLQVQRFGPRVGLEAYNAGPTRVAAGDTPQAAVDYAARALNVGGAGNTLAGDFGTFQKMIGTPDSSWMAPTMTALRADLAAQRAELEGSRRQQDDDSTTDRARVKSAFDATSKDDTTPWTQKPPPPETLQAFASAGSIFAAIASAFTRTPAISAMNGMAAAINARRDGNQKAYEEAYQVWKDNTKLAIDRQKLASDHLTQALELMRTDSADGFARAKQIMLEHGDERGLIMLEAGMYKELAEANAARDRTALQMTLKYEQLLNPTMTTTPFVGPKGEMLILQTAKDGRMIWKDAAGNLIQPPTNAPAKVGTTPADVSTPQEDKSLGAQAATGQPLIQVVPGWGAAASAKRARARDAAIKQIESENPEMTPQQAGVELANRAIQFTAAGRSTGQLTTMLGATRQAVSQLDFNIDKTKQEMAKLPSTDLSPVLNAIVRGEERWTGDPAYSSLFYYMHATALESARILAGGQASVAQLHQGAMDEAKHWADIGLTPSMFGSVADAMKAEGENRIQTYEGALKFQGVGPKPTTPQAGSGGGTTAPPPPGPHTTVFTVTPEQAKSLPPGTYYRGENDPPGAYRFKP